MGSVTNALNFPKKVIEVKHQIKHQKIFIHNYLHPILSNYYPINDGSLGEYDFEKITNYYGVGSPVLAGEAIAKFLGKEISHNERWVLTAMAAITGLFDDFFDAKNTPITHIKALIFSQQNEVATNAHEALFVELVQSIKKTINNEQRLLNRAQNVLQAQINSLKQKDTSTSWEGLLALTYRKGAESLIFYRCAFDDEIAEKELKCLEKIGGLVQICNDVFDVNKDLKEGIRTIVTETQDIADLRKKITHLHQEVFKYCRNEFPGEKMNDFLQQIKFIISQSYVALDFYQASQNKHGETFTPTKYKREALICDMGKPKNILKASKYWIFS